MQLVHVLDGISNTYLVGEKHINPDWHYTAEDYGDDQPALGADDLDMHSWTRRRPPRDTPGLDATTIFGGVHPGGFHVAFCDGSVHQTSFSIDADTHRRLGDRADGERIDSSQF